MYAFKLFLIVFSAVFLLPRGGAALDPDDAFKNYTATCQEILDVSDPFDRLDLLMEDFAEDVFEITGHIAEMIMNGPIGALANGSVTPWLPSGGTEVTLISLLSSGLPYLKQLWRTFEFISKHTHVLRHFDGLDSLWNTDWCTTAMTVDLNKIVQDVSEKVYRMGRDRSGGVPIAISLFENDKTWSGNYTWLSTDVFAYYAEIVERMLERMTALFGPNCSDTPARNMQMYYLNPNGTNFKCENSDPCLHKFLLRYSNYSERVYSKFIDVSGKTLFYALNLYGLSLPIAYKATSAEKKANAAATIKAISAQLKLAFWDDGGTNSRGEKDPISSPTVASEYWPDTAMLTAKEAFGSETATWPSPESPTEFYERIGARVQKNLTDKLTFRNWFNYSVAVYWPAEEPSDHCILNLTNDVFYERRYKNANYFVSRSGRNRNESDLKKAWQRISDSGAKTGFMKSTKPNLCDRVNEVSAKLSQPLISMEGFRSLLSVQCARNFVWYELGYRYFHAVWSSHQYVLEVRKSKFSPACVSILFFP